MSSQNIINKFLQTGDADGATGNPVAFLSSQHDDGANVPVELEPNIVGFSVEEDKIVPVPSHNLIHSVKVVNGIDPGIGCFDGPLDIPMGPLNVDLRFRGTALKDLALGPRLHRASCD